MLKIGFGGKAKPRGFDYAPRFYDEEKEEREKRYGKYKSTGETASDAENMKLRIVAGLRSKYGGDRTTRAQMERQSNIRLILIIFALSLAVYVLLSSNKLTALIESFSK